MLLWLMALLGLGASQLQDAGEVADLVDEHKADQTDFRASSRGPHLILLTWTHKLKSGFSISYREKGAQRSWLNLAPGTEGRHLFRRPNVCATFEFRLKGWLRAPSDAPIDEPTVPLNPIQAQAVVQPQIPSGLKSATPILLSNAFDVADRSAEVVFTFAAEEEMVAGRLVPGPPWPLDHILLKPYIYLIECPHEGLLAAPQPSRINATHFSVNFQSGYLISAVETGSICEALVVFQPEARICQRRVPIRDSLDSNSVLLRISCAATANLPCSDKAKTKVAPEPNCRPSSVRARPLWSQNGLLLEWSFDSEPPGEGIPAAEAEPMPLYFHLRYGLKDPASATLRIKEELGERRVRGVQSGALLPVSPTAVASRPHLVAICAVYTADAEGTSRPALNWTAVQPLLISFQSKQSLQYPPDPKDPQGPSLSSTTPASMLSNGSSEDPNCRQRRRAVGFNWRPVAITVALFTLANLVLMAMSCYLYSRAKKEARISHSSSGPSNPASHSSDNTF